MQPGIPTPDAFILRQLVRPVRHDNVVAEREHPREDAFVSGEAREIVMVEKELVPEESLGHRFENPRVGGETLLLVKFPPDHVLKRDCPPGAAGQPEFRIRHHVKAILREERHVAAVFLHDRDHALLMRRDGWRMRAEVAKPRHGTALVLK